MSVAVAPRGRDRRRARRPDRRGRRAAGRRARARRRRCAGSATPRPAPGAPLPAQAHDPHRARPARRDHPPASTSTTLEPRIRRPSSSSTTSAACACARRARDGRPLRRQSARPARSSSSTRRRTRRSARAWAAEPDHANGEPACAAAPYKPAGSSRSDRASGAQTSCPATPRAGLRTLQRARPWKLAQKKGSNGAG